MAEGRGNDAYRAGTFIFAGLAMVLAFAALAVSGVAWSRSNDAKEQLSALSEGGLLGKKVNVQLQEFSMTAAPMSVKAGDVKFDVTNTGTITHEMVLVRSPSVEALPLVQTATADRAVGDVDEEAVPESDKPGEAEVEADHSVTKTIKLTPGTYVMFCNIDTENADGSVLNHFQQGMRSVITVT